MTYNIRMATALVTAGWVACAAMMMIGGAANAQSVLDSVKTKTDDGWRVVACDVNWEDGSLLDDHTGCPIESAYAEDAA